MSHVPEDSLLSFKSSLENREQPARPVFYSVLAVRSLRELLNAIGTLPHLEELTIQFDDLVKGGHLDPRRRGCAPSLGAHGPHRRLPRPVPRRVRRPHAPHVEAIKLRIVDPEAHAGSAGIAQALLTATPNLRELRMWSVPWAPQIPFMDKLYLRASALEHLDCSQGMFVRLPAIVKDQRLAL